MEQSIPEMSVLLSSLTATKYATVASATVLVWDMALTLDLEVSRVWRVKKTLGTTLFFINRYLPPVLFVFDLSFHAHPIDTSECKNYELSSTILDLVSIGVIECVLVMRTHALYQNKILLSLLAFLCIASMAIMLTCFLIVLRYETFIPASTIGFKGCLSGCTSPLCQPLLIAFWVPFFCFETLVFVLTVWKSYKSFKVLRLSGSNNIVRIIVRDGLLYYVVIMSVSICNFLIWILDPFASYLAVGLMKSLQATITSRLLLNLRGILETRVPTISQFETDYPGSLIGLENMRPARSTDTSEPIGYAL
ncbi:hypothetical protein GALMADRAFT_1116183 [Galerina marginata CBS 339.88]|uniref:DUF6533 domain-containing protein n=1 Tax=Galerina marginata (strain CBS 339.88) TaxID=685588 RepID=A0A067TM37_GALM3|nr:hypothetical protein GALMADRAFT_1116183 [Galerina marginata CBS 339.88]